MWRLVCVAGLACATGACVPGAPELVRQYNEDGVFLFQRGRYDYARESFQAATVLQPENPDLLYNLGQCHDRLAEAARAEHYYRETLLRSPNHPECRHALTLLLVRQGRRDEAVQMVADWMRQSSTESAAYAEDGWLFAQANDPVRALKRFQQAVDLNPHDVRALIEMGRTYEQMHYPERALVLYEHALLVKADLPEVAQRVTLLRRQGTGPPRPDD
jgi:Flp pilus assembly protein TadD